MSGVTLVLTGCASGSEPCTSSGANSGEIVSSALSGTLGVTKTGASTAKNKAGLSLGSSGVTPFASFTCGTTSVTVKGAIIGELKPDSMLTKQTLKFGLSKGSEKVKQFVGGPELTLEAKVGAGSYERAGLGMTPVQTSEEAVEINTVV